MPSSPNGTHIHAGIDEAGLGPMLGPLCIGWCVTDSPGVNEEIDHWDLWSGAVTQTHPRRSETLFVADSKRVFDGSPRGRARLEATALAFFHASGNPAVTGLDIAHSPAPALRHSPLELESSLFSPESAPWYREWLGPLLPHPDLERLQRQESALAIAMKNADCRVLEAAVRIAPAGELNASFERTQNKATSTWALIGPVLRHLWETYSEQGVSVVLDRQGGRRRYGNLLSQEFPFSQIQILEENKDRACYRIQTASRLMVLRVRPRAEDTSLPVAVGSCLAKYARESVMEAFNRWFSSFQADLKPTAGYVTDARRWLQDAGPALAKAKIPSEQLVRTR